VFARVVNGGAVGTTLVVANGSGAALEVRWQAYDAQGRALWGSVRSVIPAHGTLARNVGELFGQGAGVGLDGSVEGEVVPLSGAGNGIEGVVAGSASSPQAAGLALRVEGSGVSSLAAQRPTTGLRMLTVGAGRRLGGGSGSTALSTSGWLVGGEIPGTVNLLCYGGDGRRLGSRTVTVAAHGRMKLEEVMPAGTELVVLRGRVPVVAYQEQGEGSGSTAGGAGRALGARAVPPVVGGAIALSAELGGAVLALDARASVAVPLGALAEDTAITIESLTPATAPLPPPGLIVLAGARVSPLGLQFRQPVGVEFPVLQAARLPDGTHVQIYDAGTKTYRATPYEVRSGVGGTTVVTTVEEFPSGPEGTVWVVLVPSPTGPVFGGGGGGGGGGSGSGGGVVPPGGAGGVVTSADGRTAVVVPPGAVPSSTTITVTSVSPGTLPPPPNQQTVVLAARVEPSGLQFQTPVVLQFQVPAALQGRLPGQMPVGIYNPLTSQYEATSFTAVLSADGGTLTASVTHFTVFVVLQPFTPFASTILPPGVLVRPLGLVSLFIPAIPDTTPPTVTINQAVGQADPTNTLTINFTVVFSEAVTGFATGDVTLSGTAGATTATVTGSGTTYNVAVSGMTASGTVIASIGAGVATDLAGNPNLASTSTDNSVTFALQCAVPPPGTLVMGNDSCARSPIDSFSNFTIVDTNHPAASSGVLQTFRYYAANANPIRFVVVDPSNVVKFVSEQITPAVVPGENTYTPPSPVPVQAGWNVGLYFVSTGTIPFDGGGTAASYTNSDAGLPVVGSALPIVGSANRIYSFVATGTVIAGPIITTVAGNGVATFGGDGGQAISASLQNPRGVAVDASGNLYVADFSNHRIRKVDTAGIITTFAGGNGTAAFSGEGVAATSASLNFPNRVAVDAAGNLYIADRNNNRVRKVNTAGIITTVAGNGVRSFSGDGGAAISASLDFPTGVAVDAAGNLYIADGDNSRIRKVNTAGIITTVAGTVTSGFSGDDGPATSAALDLRGGVAGVAVDAAGNLYIADRGNHRIREVDTAGIITTVAGNGAFVFSGDGGPTDVAVDAAGNLFIAADIGSNRIRKVDTAGIITTIAGDGSFAFSGDGGPATSARLNQPLGVAVDAAGNLYIGDQSNHRVRKVTTQFVAAPSGLVSWWRAEGNANDSVGSNHGTLQGGVTFAPGEVGQAFNLNGTTAYVSVPASASLNVGATGSGLTIDAWINPADVSVQHPIAEWNNGSAIGAHLWMSVTSQGGALGSLFANIADTAGNFHIFQSPGSLVAPNTFQHVALTYDKASGMATLLLNGVVVAQQNLGTFTPQTTYDLYFGFQRGNWFAGLMDEIEVFNRALTVAEIQAIFNAGSSGKLVPPVVAINQAATQSDPTAASPINFTVVFNEAVTGFSNTDVTVTGSAPPGTKTVTVTGGPSTYNVAVSGMTGSGTVIASIAAGASNAGGGASGTLSGLPNAASVSMDNTVTFDNLGPTVTINLAATQADPAGGSPPTFPATINFTVVFSDPATGFVTGDVTLSGTAGATTQLVTGGPTTYNVAVSGMTTSGTVIASIAAAKATDALGNPNAASTSTDNSVTYSDLTANPGGDFDGDGLTNAAELPLGTNPVITDTDGDGFPDGMETAAATNPLDSGSKPVTSQFSNEAVSPPFSVLNTTPPVANPQAAFTEASTNLFSILNTTPPVPNPQAAFTEASSGVFSVKNGP